MQRPRFSEMLIARRQQLGLTIEQASKVLKLREPVLIAFEEGDFANIPKSGYAQGMLSSYARYLGLNPRQIVDQFQEDLYEFENGVTSHDLRKKTREGRLSGEASYELPGETGSIPVNYPTMSLLQEPTVLATSDAFTTTSTARSRSQRYQQSSPLVNPYGTQSSYSSVQQPYGYSSQTPGYGQVSTPVGAASGGYQASGYGQDYASQDYYGSSTDITSDLGQSTPRRFTTLDPEKTSGGSLRPRGYSQASGRYGSYSVNLVDVPRYGDPDIVSRSVGKSQYRDDLRYDDAPAPYEAAYTSQGRRGSRNIANTQRPKVSRRRSATSRNVRNQPGRRRPVKRGGVAGFIDSLTTDKTRLLVMGGLILVLVLVIIITASVKSCVATRTETPKPQVPVTSPTQKNSEEDKQTTEQNSTGQGEQDGKTDANAAAAQAAADKKAQEDLEPKVTEVKVHVAVAQGQIAWVEIKCDGSSVVAEQITGPWEKEFDVLKGFTIQTNNPSAVSVQNNGAAVEFDSKASGIGTISIDGPDDPEPEETSEQSGQNANKTGSQKKSGSNNKG